MFLVFLLAFGAGIGVAYGVWGNDAIECENDSGGSPTVKPDETFTTEPITTGSLSTIGGETIEPEVTSPVDDMTTIPSSDAPLVVSLFNEKYC